MEALSICRNPGGDLFAVNQETVNQLKGRRNGIWLAIALFGIAGVYMGNEGQWGIGLCCIGMSIVGVFALLKVNRNLNGTLSPYVPGKGYRYYRTSRKTKLRLLTGVQAIVVLIVVAGTVYLQVSYYVIGTGLMGILFVQFYTKKRIALHTDVDPNSLQELRDLGILSSAESVRAVYKDFVSWEKVRPGYKILVVTRDTFISLRMEDETDAVRLDCRLRDINRVGLVAFGRQGKGLLMSIGTVENDVLRVKLDGNSYRDSPEQFVSRFLACLDEALTTPAEVQPPARPPAPPAPPVVPPVPPAPTDSGPEPQAAEPPTDPAGAVPPNIRVRMIDLHDSAVANGPAGDKPGAAPSSAKGRHIDL